MIYILIVLWAGGAEAGKAAIAVEFNNLASCRAAAAEVNRQEKYSRMTVLCAAKGHKQ